MEKVNIDRKPGEPLTFDIDLKWSLWSSVREYWQEYAPECFKHLEAGFAGDFDETGDRMLIRTAPRKEIRFGEVEIDPKEGMATVSFRAEFDDDSAIERGTSFPLPDTLEEFLTMVDGIEEDLIEAVQAA